MPELLLPDRSNAVMARRKPEGVRGRDVSNGRFYARNPISREAFCPCRPYFASDEIVIVFNPFG